jgi:apolipoprotein N-acyltransferase
VLGFAASELLYPLLFPWYLGATVLELPGLAQAADLGGPILVGALVLLLNLAGAELVLARLESRRPHPRTLAWGLALPALALGYGQARIVAVDRRVAEAPAARVGIVQGNVPIAARFSTIDRQLRLTRDARRRGAELVVWSESAVAGAFLESDLRQVERRIGERLGGPAVIHSALRQPDPGGAGYTSRSASLLLDGHGRIAGRYDKQKLLMFGEYLPFGEALPVLHRWSPNSGRFVPGRSHDPLVWRGRRITVLICYEDILPSLVNRMVASAAPELLVNQTNDAWFLDSVEPWLHLGLSRFRAIEHRRFLVRATNTGVSAIVDPAGRVVLQGGSFREESLVGQVRFLRARTVYQALGDVPWWIASALSLAAAFVRAPPARGHPAP